MSDPLESPSNPFVVNIKMASDGTVPEFRIRKFGEPVNGVPVDGSLISHMVDDFSRMTDDELNGVLAALKTEFVKRTVVASLVNGRK